MISNRWLAAARGASIVSLLAFSGEATPPGASAAQPPPARADAGSSLAHDEASTNKPNAALTDLARSVLRKRMERHGKMMTNLVEGVILLQRDVVLELAGTIASEPRLTRPIVGGANDLNAALPERFFVLQDQLRERAQALGAAAKQSDDDLLALRFADLTRTCVACHAAFLDPDQAPRKLDGGATH
jgi:hypothetical protein